MAERGDIGALEVELGVELAIGLELAVIIALCVGWCWCWCFGLKAQDREEECHRYYLPKATL